MAYMEKYDSFLGTGEPNKAGESLGEFLEKYDPKKYDNPINTVDTLIFQRTGEVTSSKTMYGAQKRPLKLLMIRRGNHPSIGWWALPGGFVELRESLEEAAERELFEETGLSGIPIFQVRTFSKENRDPRWHIITTSYVALVSGECKAKAGDDAADALWFDVQLQTESLSDTEDRLMLTLTSKERGLTITTTARRHMRRQGFLLQDSFTLEKSDGIAGDHGIIIMDALFYLERHGER